MAYGRNGRVVSDKKLGPSLDKRFQERIKRIEMIASDDKYKKKGEETTTEKNQKANQKIFNDFRVLPLVVLVASLVLVIKIPDIFKTVERLLLNTSVVAYAEAQETRGSKAEKTREIPGKKASKNELEKKDKDEKPLDPVLFTRSEIELLQELSRRRKELDGRERAIIQREGLLMAAESRLEVKINELELIKTDIETLITKYNAQEEEKFKAQGLNDFVVYSIHAIGSLSTGIFIALTNWKTMNLICIPFMILIILATIRAELADKKNPSV